MPRQSESSTSSAGEAVPVQNIVVVPQEQNISPLTGHSPRELHQFLDDLEDLWVQRPDYKAEQKSKRTWNCLSREVKQELQCQGISRDTPYAEIISRLKATYGERRNVSQLAVAFHSCQQGQYETLRRYTQRLQAAYQSLVGAQKAMKCRPIEPSMLTEQFIEGLQMQQLKVHLRQCRMTMAETPFEEMREIAIKLQGGDEEEITVKAAAVKTEDDHQKPMAAMADATKALEAVMAKGFADMLTVLKSTTQEQTNNRPPQSCYSCGQPGHYANACPDRQQQSRQPPRFQQRQQHQYPQHHLAQSQQYHQAQPQQQQRQQQGNASRQL